MVYLRLSGLHYNDSRQIAKGKMMIQSMTAFARHNGQAPWGEFSWEVRSLNSRFVEISLRLPDNLREFEYELREMCRAYINRGKIECFLKVQQAPTAQTSVVVNQALVQSIVTACESLDSYNYPLQPLDPLKLLQWPGVTQQGSLSAETFKQEIFAGFTTCMSGLVTARELEGSVLTRFLLEHLRAITDEVKAIRAYVPQVIALNRKKMTARLDEMRLSVDAARIEQEMALLIQKCDITEELDRLSTHVAAITGVLTEGGVVGRRVDFLIQELHREANTITSKSVDAEMSGRAVELKVRIEQMREQIQNIE
jgi:uncharacterized protein (TIGR00255 family)